VTSATSSATQVLLGPAQSPRAFGKSFGDMAPPLQFQAEPYQDLLTPALLWRADDAGTAVLPRSPTPARDR
jgi:hypothetical protein